MSQKETPRKPTKPAAPEPAKAAPAEVPKPPAPESKPTSSSDEKSSKRATSPVRFEEAQDDTPKQKWKDAKDAAKQWKQVVPPDQKGQNAPAAEPEPKPLAGRSQSRLLSSTSTSSLPVGKSELLMDIEAAASNPSLKDFAADVRKTFEKLLADTPAPSTKAQHLRSLIMLFDDQKPEDDPEEQLRIRIALLEIHAFYSKMHMHPANCLFDELNEAKQNMQLAHVHRFLKNFGIGKLLISKQEVTECFNFACDSKRSLNSDQFMTFVFNVARLIYSRPPHNVPLDKCLSFFYTALITDHFRSRLTVVPEALQVQEVAQVPPPPVKLAESFAPVLQEYAASRGLERRLGVKPGAAATALVSKKPARLLKPL